VKDYAIPVSVVDDPYFEHQMLFLDRQYNTLEKAKMLEKSLARYGGEDEFLKEMRRLRNEIIDHVKDHPDYETLGSRKIPIPPSKDRKIAERSIYKEIFCGKDMVSLDLVKANFQSFQQYSTKIVNEKDTYEEFVGDFTDDKYFVGSKKIRQVIFGNLNPKRQMTITKHMMYALKHKLNFYSTDVLTLSADELVFEIPDYTNLDGLEQYVDKLHEKVRIQGFRIEKVPTKTSSIFVKKYPNGTFDLKCCPGNYTVEVLRHIYDEPVHPLDRVFYNDGRVCEYKDSLFE
jgi:hypothetical protein